MSKRREVMTVSYIQDDDCGMYRIGEIDTNPEADVQAYITRFGEFGYTELLDFCASLMTAARKSIITHRARDCVNKLQGQS